MQDSFDIGNPSIGFTKVGSVWHLRILKVNVYGIGTKLKAEYAR